MDGGFDSIMIDNLSAHNGNNKIADWKLNPWVALPQWVGFRANKT